MTPERGALVARLLSYDAGEEAEPTVRQPDASVGNAPVRLLKLAP